MNYYDGYAYDDSYDKDPAEYLALLEFVRDRNPDFMSVVWETPPWLPDVLELADQGLVHRSVGSWGSRFSITPKGIEKIEWLTEAMQTKESE